MEKDQPLRVDVRQGSIPGHLECAILDGYHVRIASGAVQTCYLPRHEVEKLVQEFARRMVVRIFQNAHKGLREAWLEFTPDRYLQELQMNTAELRGALAYGIDVMDKAVDVAVDAMIIVDQHTHGKKITGD